LTLSTEYILQSCQNALQLPKDYLVIEGAGGLLVPLNEQETLLDLIRVFALPVILVVGMKLRMLEPCLAHSSSIASTPYSHYRLGSKFLTPPYAGC
jgi:dethiobiotin synthetase